MKIDNHSEKQIKLMLDSARDYYNLRFVPAIIVSNNEDVKND